VEENRRSFTLAGKREKDPAADGSLSVPTMKSEARLLLAFTLFWQVVISIEAAPPRSAFTYQGRLRDGDAPASGSYDFRFVLYDAAVDGNQVGTTLTADNLTVLGGVFTASVDFGAVFEGSPRWLEIAVRPGVSVGDFTVLSPRQPLTAAPYALYALTPAGPQGIQGPKGEQGAIGATGPIGASGPQGLKGDTGLNGPQGLTGLMASQGPAGPKGDTGVAGASGATGAQGPSGVAGIAGPKGDKGDPGLTGRSARKAPSGSWARPAHKVPSGSPDPPVQQDRKEHAG
jgi:hypothetical protein